MTYPEFLFHGGCHDCTMQSRHGTDVCFDCCHFEADWSKPNLNIDPVEAERQAVKQRRLKNPLKDQLQYILQRLQEIERLI